MLLTSNELLLMLTKTNNQPNQNIVFVMNFQVYTHRHTQTHTQTHTKTHTHRHTDRQTDRQTDTHTHNVYVYIPLFLINIKTERSFLYEHLKWSNITVCDKSWPF